MPRYYIAFNKAKLQQWLQDNTIVSLLHTIYTVCALLFCRVIALIVLVCVTLRPPAALGVFSLVSALRFSYSGSLLFLCYAPRCTAALLSVLHFCFILLSVFLLPPFVFCLIPLSVCLACLDMLLYVSCVICCLSCCLPAPTDYLSSPLVLCSHRALLFICLQPTCSLLTSLLS